jgi:hypothetical protein
MYSYNIYLTVDFNITSALFFNYLLKVLFLLKIFCKFVGEGHIFVYFSKKQWLCVVYLVLFFVCFF